MLAAAARLVADAFDGDFSDQDWEHSLGGMHATAWDGDELVGHASVVARRMLHGGRALRCGYVEGLGVRADHRRHGCASALMAEMERIVRGGYDLGALAATDQAVPLYTGRGWLRWQGTTWTLTPDGLVRTEDEDDAIYVLPLAVPLDLTGELACDWRDGDAW
ncbi:MAG TPA: GNAT family N-acetyltransferase [Pseudonocardiaceae bacterium]|nr:GNAT family N-acetyltransferase [Pseudonocardiaceae bacterium]